MSSMLQNDLGAYAQAAVDAGASSSASGLQAVLEIQRGWILDQSAGISESFDYSFGEFGGLGESCLLNEPRLIARDF